MLAYVIIMQVVDNKITSPKEVLAIEYKKTPEVQEECPPSTSPSPSPSPPPPPAPEPVKVEAPAAKPAPDLLVILWIFVLCFWHILIIIWLYTSFVAFAFVYRIWMILFLLLMSWKKRMPWLWPLFQLVNCHLFPPLVYCIK